MKPICWLLTLAIFAALTGCDSKPANPTPAGGGGADAQPDSTPTAKTPADGERTIAVIPKGTTHVFWRSVEAGARQAEKETGVKVIWKGPLKENDRAAQIQLLQQFVAQKVSGIAVAPLDFKGLVGPIKDAMAAGVPVVAFDSAIDAEPGKDFVSFIATDNEKGGRLGGEQLAKVLGSRGKAALLRFAVGSASTDAREKGFVEALKLHRDIQLIVDNRYGGATASEAKTAALNMLDQIKQADGIFTPNESTTLGMLLALRQEGLAGKIKFVGFDASPQLVDALKAGEIDALVVQNPRKMGYESVKALAAHLKGEKVPAEMDTGVAVVTKENLETPEIKALIE